MLSLTQSTRNSFNSILQLPHMNEHFQMWVQKSLEENKCLQVIHLLELVPMIRELVDIQLFDTLCDLSTDDINSLRELLIDHELSKSEEQMLSLKNILSSSLGNFALEIANLPKQHGASMQKLLHDYSTAEKQLGQRIQYFMRNIPLIMNKGLEQYFIFKEAVQFLFIKQSQSTFGEWKKIGNIGNMGNIGNIGNQRRKEQKRKEQRRQQQRHHSSDKKLNKQARHINTFLMCKKKH